MYTYTTYIYICILYIYIYIYIYITIVTLISFNFSKHSKPGGHSELWRPIELGLPWTPAKASVFTVLMEFTDSTAAAVAATGGSTGDGEKVPAKVLASAPTPNDFTSDSAKVSPPRDLFTDGGMSSDSLELATSMAANSSISAGSVFLCFLCFLPERGDFEPLLVLLLCGLGLDITAVYLLYAMRRDRLSSFPIDNCAYILGICVGYVA